MLLDVEGAMELLRGVPIAGWLLFSVALLSAHVSPANSVHDFAAYRMQHYDLHGARYGRWKRSPHLLSNEHCILSNAHHTQLLPAAHVIMYIFLFPPPVLSIAPPPPPPPPRPQVHAVPW